MNNLKNIQEPTYNNNISPPPLPPALLPGLGQALGLPSSPPFILPPPSSGGLFTSFQPPPARSDNSFGNFHIRPQLSCVNFSNTQGLSGNSFGSKTQVLEREKEKLQDSVQKELDDTIYELPDPPKLVELGDGLLNLLSVQADEILEQNFVNQKQQEDAVLEQIKEEYCFGKIKKAFDEAAVPHQLDFFYGGENSNFNQSIEFSSPSNENREFIAFLISDQGHNLMTNNSSSIHIETGGIFYQNFNTGENFYNLILAQQDD